MCQECVSLGVITQQQLDEALAAGDRTVVPYRDRVAQGEDVNEMLAELEVFAAALGLSLDDVITTIERRIASRDN